MLSPGAKLGPYTILSFIGAGGMGRVYRARDSRLDRDVAIKVLTGELAADADAISRFEREAKAVAALSHPNIVAIFDFGRSDGVIFAVTELLEGETLRELLRRGRMAWRRVCEVGVAVAEALAAAHGRGIIHRDLKPENIFLGRDGRVKILDFGLARSTAPLGRGLDGRTHDDDAVTERQETLPGVMVGTLGYMSPEQVKGENVEATTDLFALGCVLYEMLAGERPFSRNSPIEVVAAILAERPKPLTAPGLLVPIELEQLVLHCLAKDPAARYQSARDVALTLQSLLDNGPTEIASRPPFEKSGGSFDFDRVPSDRGASDRSLQTPAVEAPVTHYALSGDVNIAYQVVGNGPLDLVFVMGWITHLEYFWQEPSFARFLRRLASFSRLILIDKRGTGLSDRVPLDELPTLEQRMDDVRAVMEAVGSSRAALLGISEGGPMCSLFAATYPERTTALVMIGTYAKRIRDDDYPWGPTAEQRQAFFELMQREWGGPVGIVERAPSRATDPVFRDWWAKYLRMGASPGAAVALTRMNAEIDVRHVLPTIRVPSLIVHRSGDRCLKVEEGRYVASQIPNAKYVELPGDDHLPFVGDQDAITDEVEEFLTGVRHRSEPDRVLATILHVRQAGGEGSMESHRSTIERELAWFRGRLIRLGGDRLQAAFDGPARAVRCADALCRSMQRASMPVAAGLHTGECDLGADTLSGLPLEIGAAVSARATSGQVLVSQTVRDLVAGSGIAFGEGEVMGEWRVYRVEKC
jgi:serine/threonine protein kinase/alpha-beta hydrolase superfamily lysophospholipase